MKTLQELYIEVLNSEELKKSFADAVRNNKVEDFLKANGCEADSEELTAFLKEQQTKAAELSDEELDSVAGGCNSEEAAISLYTAMVGCIVVTIISGSGGKTSLKEHEFKKNDTVILPDKKILCTDET